MKWIKLINEKPPKLGTYKCFFLQYGKWAVEHLKWTQDGFQYFDYGEPGTWPLSMNVTHWLKEKEIPLPIEEAKKLIIETEIFIYDRDLYAFMRLNNIEILELVNSGIEIITTNLSETVLTKMRKKFKGLGVHINVRKV